MLMHPFHRSLPLFALFLCIVLSACQQKSEAPTEAPKEEAKVDPNVVILGPQLKAVVQMGAVNTVEMKDTLRIPGRIQVDEQYEARVGATVTGRISEINVALGDQVKAGQVLAHIKSTELAQYQLSYIKSVQQVQLLSKAVDRAKLLLESDVISPAELQRREAEYNAAKAELNASRDQLQVLGMPPAAISKLGLANSGMSMSTVSSKINGTVIQRKARIGEVVAPTEDLFVVADLSKVWAVAEVPEQQLEHLRNGETIKIEVPALNGKLMDGQINYVGDIVNAETRTIMARASLQNNDRLLKPDMLISILLEAKSRQTLAVPVTSVVREENKDFVFVQTGPDKVTLREVSLGNVFEGFVSVNEGLTEGDTIVTDGAFHVNNERKRKEME